MNQENETSSPQWSMPPQILYKHLNSSPHGLSSAEAQARLSRFGRNELVSREKVTPILLFLNQFKNPLVLILVIAAIISIVTGSYIDAIIILAILFASAVLGFVEEYRASNAMEKLRGQMTLKTKVLRDGVPQTIPA